MTFSSHVLRHHEGTGVDQDVHVPPLVGRGRALEGAQLAGVERHGAAAAAAVVVVAVAAAFVVADDGEEDGGVQGDAGPQAQRGHQPEGEIVFILL